MIVWTCQNVPKRPRAPKHIFGWGLEYEKSGNLVPVFEICEKHEKDAHEKSLQNGSYAFPNELMRFRNEANTIWGQIRKHCKNAVII